MGLSKELFIEERDDFATMSKQELRIFEKEMQRKEQEYEQLKKEKQNDSINKGVNRKK